MSDLNLKHQKVSGKSSGTVPSMKKDGYAGTTPDPIVIPNKVGRTNHKGYSGPDVARGKHPGA